MPCIVLLDSMKVVVDPAAGIATAPTSLLPCQASSTLHRSFLYIDRHWIFELNVIVQRRGSSSSRRRSKAEAAAKEAAEEATVNKVLVK
jgi:hypothetical protein